MTEVATHEPDQDAAAAAGAVDLDAVWDARVLRRLTLEVIAPAMNSAIVGSVTEIDPAVLVPNPAFADIVPMFERGPRHLVRHFRRSQYYHYTHDARGWPFVACVGSVAWYYRLYCSIRRRGFVTDRRRPGSYPWVFRLRHGHILLEGQRRVSIARYLRTPRLPVVLVRPADLLPLAGVPDDWRDYFAGLPV